MKETLLLILKIVLFALVIPILVGLTLAFKFEVAAFDEQTRQLIVLGMFSYIISKFFIYDFKAVYVVGQNIVTGMFGFLKPLVAVAPYVLPIYTLLILAGIAVVNAMNVAGPWKDVLVFALSFTFCMHIILTAQDLYEKDSIAGKPNYFFNMSLVFLFDIFLIALLGSLAMRGFSFPHFFNRLTDISWHIYLSVFKQLFT